MNLIRKITSTLISCSIAATVSLAAEFTPSNNKNLAVKYTFDKPNEKEFQKFIHEDLKKIGFYVNDPHPNVQQAYTDEFGKTKMDYIGFSSIMNEDVVRPLLNKDPRLGGFSPFNLLNYRKKSDMTTVISHLTPEAMLDMLQIDDEEIRTKFIASFKPLDDLIEKKLGGKKSYIPLHGHAKDSMMNFEIPFGEVDDLDDYTDEFEENFRSAFGEKGFIVAGFYNIKESFNSQEDVMPGYRMFWSIDLCHIPFSYAMFDGDTEEGIPEAGIFAPCSIYIYIKEDENKIVIGMPTVEGWAAALNITDDAKVRFIDRMEEEIPAVFKSLGGVSVANGNPLHQ